MEQSCVTREHSLSSQRTRDAPERKVQHSSVTYSNLDSTPEFRRSELVAIDASFRD